MGGTSKHANSACGKFHEKPACFGFKCITLESDVESTVPDSIPPLDQRWLLVAWLADFANVGPTSLDQHWPNRDLQTTTQVRYLYILPTLGQR